MSQGYYLQGVCLGRTMQEEENVTGELSVADVYFASPKSTITDFMKDSNGNKKNSCSMYIKQFFYS